MPACAICSGLSEGGEGGGFHSVKVTPLVCLQTLCAVVQYKEKLAAIHNATARKLLIYLISSSVSAQLLEVFALLEVFQLKVPRSGCTSPRDVPLCSSGI